MTEDWRPVVGWEGAYEVSNQGRVRSLARKVWNPRAGGFWVSVPGGHLRGSTNQSGHTAVALMRANVRSMRQVHRLVLEAFVGECPDGLEGCHYNGDPSDNALSNLRWDTRAANQADSVRHGTHGNTKKTHCPQNHPYSTENTHYDGSSRCCRICGRERTRRWRERRAALAKVAA